MNTKNSVRYNTSKGSEMKDSLQQTEVQVPKLTLPKEVTKPKKLDQVESALAHKIAVLNGLNKLLSSNIGTKASKNPKAQDAINLLFKQFLTESINKILSPEGTPAGGQFTSEEVASLKALALSVKQRVGGKSTPPAKPTAAPIVEPKQQRSEADVSAYVKANEQFLLELKKMDLLYDPN